MSEQHPKHSTWMAELRSLSWVFTGSCYKIFDQLPLMSSKIIIIKNSSNPHQQQSKQYPGPECLQSIEGWFLLVILAPNLTKVSENSGGQQKENKIKQAKPPQFIVAMEKTFHFTHLLSDRLLTVPKQCSNPLLQRNFLSWLSRANRKGNTSRHTQNRIICKNWS